VKIRIYTTATRRFHPNIRSRKHHSPPTHTSHQQILLLLLQTKMNATPRLLGKALKAIGPKEPHPYFIYPKTAAAYPINPAFLGQRLGRTART